MTARHTSALEALLVDQSFDGDIYPGEPLARHTTYHIGGPARFYVCVSSLSALSQLVKTCDASDVEWIAMGKGSNLLVCDEGFDGVAFTLGQDFKTCRFDEEHSSFSVGAGVPLSSVVQDAFKRGLAGLEFAVGTPGTIGGAVRMNAGSRDEWIGSRIVSVTTFSPACGLKRYAGADIEWGYRSCSIPVDEIVLECELSVQSALPSFIRGKMEAALAKRKKSQPLNLASCGSVFKNPDGRSAGALIEEAGLKGERRGGAQISDKHANFIVNVGNATARDVMELIELARTKVKEAYGIELQPEVRFLGFS
ncbi:UDP-N-acetylmuramate dehydrogenase [Raoultibacter massiliensis]|uniref:UDP-N-acetylenolpyruvoylglucosamine reductase n=2 Tax=Raoultibacter massiliensis TaxID=1852371 RepID=A0ABV1JDQ1_9ACTN